MGFTALYYSMLVSILFLPSLGTAYYQISRLSTLTVEYMIYRQVPPTHHHQMRQSPYVLYYKYSLHTPCNEITKLYSYALYVHDWDYLLIMINTSKFKTYI